jgi:Uma2 family endonuclease
MTDTIQTINRSQIEPVERFVFDDVDWAFYETVLGKVGGRRVFVTFDGERLEVMSPSWEHDKYGDRLAEFVRIVLTELRLPFEGGGSFTLKEPRSNRGLEADHWFYIGNARAILGKRKIVLETDPPPDLAIEIEITRRLLDRIDVYEQLGVPEVWCYDGKRLRVLRLDRGAGYRDVPASPTFPNLPPEQVHRLLQQAWDVDQLAWADLVRDFVRNNLLPRS